MSHIETLSLWNQGVTACDAGNWQEGLARFTEINDASSIILFNSGRCYLAMGQFDHAIQAFSKAVEKDNFLAVGYFQRGVAYYKCSRWREAERDFEKCQQYFRGRKSIDYKKLRMRCNLHVCEAMYNQALTMAQQGVTDWCKKLLTKAQDDVVEAKHRLIQDALESKDMRNLPLIDLPSDAIFTPPKDKLRNMKKTDYLGEAKVVSALEHTDTDTGFMGPKRIQEMRESLPSSSRSSSAPSSPVSDRRSKAKDLPVINGQRGSPPLGRSSRTFEAAGPPPDRRPPPPNKPVPQLPRPASKQHQGPRAGLAQVLSKLRTSEDVTDSQPKRPKIPKELLNAGKPVTNGIHNSDNAGSGQDDIAPVRPSRTSLVQEPGTAARVPPSRPAPGYKPKPLPQAPGNDSDQVRAPPEPETPLQKRIQELNNKGENQTGAKQVLVRLTCHEESSIDVSQGTSLQDLLKRAAEVFGMDEGTFDLWYKNVRNEMRPVSGERELQLIWKNLTKPELNLWCYGKQ